MPSLCHHSAHRPGPGPGDCPPGPSDQTLLTCPSFIPVRCWGLSSVTALPLQRPKPASRPAWPCIAVRWPVPCSWKGESERRKPLPKVSFFLRCLSCGKSRTGVQMPAQRAELRWRRTCVAAAAALGLLEARDTTKSLSSEGADQPSWKPRKDFLLVTRKTQPQEHLSPV